VVDGADEPPKRESPFSKQDVNKSEPQAKTQAAIREKRVIDMKENGLNSLIHHRLAEAMVRGDVVLLHHTLVGGGHP